MDLGLAGKRALVTGSTAGIGLATAQALAREGAHVIINGRTEGRVAAAVSELRRTLSGARIGGVAADLTTSSGKSAAQVEKEFFQTARPSSVLQRFADPAEIAALITYVCSAAASATTGAALRADGGVVRSIV
jgi:NAD(P)-dependent dehydrogenase (short-subunit alcohol dehydrogenase family)